MDKKTHTQLDLGDGLSITMGIGDDVSFFYTNKINVPDGLPKGFKIEVSSTELEDTELLHYLLDKM